MSSALLQPCVVRLHRMTDTQLRLHFRRSLSAEALTVEEKEVTTTVKEVSEAPSEDGSTTIKLTACLGKADAEWDAGTLGAIEEPGDASGWCEVSVRQSEIGLSEERHIVDSTVEEILGKSSEDQSRKQKGRKRKHQESGESGVVNQEAPSVTSGSDKPSKRKIRKMAEMPDFLEREKNMSILNDICRYEALRKYYSVRKYYGCSTSRLGGYYSSPPYHTSSLPDGNDMKCDVTSTSSGEPISPSHPLPHSHTFTLSPSTVHTNSTEDYSQTRAGVSIFGFSSHRSNGYTKYSKEIGLRENKAADNNENKDTTNSTKEKELRNVAVDYSQCQTRIQEATLQSPVETENTLDTSGRIRPAEFARSFQLSPDLEIVDVKEEVDSVDFSEDESPLVIDESFSSSLDDCEIDKPQEVSATMEAATDNSVNKFDNGGGLKYNSIKTPEGDCADNNNKINFESKLINNYNEVECDEYIVCDESTDNKIKPMSKSSLKRNETLKNRKCTNAHEQSQEYYVIESTEKTQTTDNEPVSAFKTQNAIKMPFIQKIKLKKISNRKLQTSGEVNDANVVREARKQLKRYRQPDKGYVTDWKTSDNTFHTNSGGLVVNGSEQTAFADTDSQRAHHAAHEEKRGRTTAATPTEDNVAKPVIPSSPVSPDLLKCNVRNEESRRDVLRKLLQNDLNTQEHNSPTHMSPNQEPATHVNKTKPTTNQSQVPLISQTSEAPVITSSECQDWHTLGDFNKVIYLMYRELLSPLSQQLITQMSEILHLVIVESLRFSERSRSAKQLSSVELAAHAEELARRDFHANTTSHGIYFSHLFKTIEKCFPVSRAFHTFMYLALFVHLFKHLKAIHAVHANRLHMTRKLVVTMLKVNRYYNMTMFTAVCKGDEEFETDFQLVSQLISTFDAYAESSNEPDCFAYDTTYFVYPPATDKTTYRVCAAKRNCLPPNVGTSQNNGHFQRLRSLRAGSVIKRANGSHLHSQFNAQATSNLFDPRPVHNQAREESPFSQENPFPPKRLKVDLYQYYGKPTTNSPETVQRDTNSLGNSEWCVSGVTKPVPIHQRCTVAGPSPTTSRRSSGNYPGPQMMDPQLRKRQNEPERSCSDGDVVKPNPGQTEAGHFDQYQPQRSSEATRRLSGCSMHHLIPKSGAKPHRTMSSNTIRKPIPLLPKCRVIDLTGPSPSQSLPSHFGKRGPPNVFLLPNCDFAHPPHYSHYFAVKRPLPVPPSNSTHAEQPMPPSWRGPGAPVNFVVLTNGSFAPYQHGPHLVPVYGPTPTSTHTHVRRGNPLPPPYSDHNTNMAHKTSDGSSSTFEPRSMF